MSSQTETVFSLHGVKQHWWPRADEWSWVTLMNVGFIVWSQVCAVILFVLIMSHFTSCFHWFYNVWVSSFFFFCQFYKQTCDRHCGVSVPKSLCLSNINEITLVRSSFVLNVSCSAILVPFEQFIYQNILLTRDIPAMTFGTSVICTFWDFKLFQQFFLFENERKPLQHPENLQNIQKFSGLWFFNFLYQFQLFCWFYLFHFSTHHSDLLCYSSATLNFPFVPFIFISLFPLQLFPAFSWFLLLLLFICIFVHITAVLCPFEAFVFSVGHSGFHLNS